MAVEHKKTLAEQKQEDIHKMVVCKTHLGTRNIDFRMKPYVFKRTTDGVHLIDVSKTWEKIQIAARVIAAIEDPSDIVVISQRPYGSRAVMKFAQHVGAQAMASRWTPGTLTNQITTKFMEPRLIIVTDPRTDFQAVQEAASANIPCIDNKNLRIPLLAMCGGGAPESSSKLTLALLPSSPSRLLKFSLPLQFGGCR